MFYNYTPTALIYTLSLHDALPISEYVRMNLKQYIGFKFSGGKPVLSVHLLDPGIEQAVQGGIQQSASGSSLALDPTRSEEHTSELQSLAYLVCRLLLEKKK